MREKAYTIRIAILACAFARMPLMSGFAPTPKEVTHATPHCFLLIEWLLIPGLQHSIPRGNANAKNCEEACSNIGSEGRRPQCLMAKPTTVAFLFKSPGHAC